LGAEGDGEECVSPGFTVAGRRERRSGDRKSEHSRSEKGWRSTSLGGKVRRVAVIG